MSNPYFKNSFDPLNNEDNLYRNATSEIVEMLGIDFKYIPKSLGDPDYIFGEDHDTTFNAYKDVTMLIENYMNFEGDDQVFSKFGFEIDNKLILIIEQAKFMTYVGEEPEVGDLIYHPNSGKTFKLSHIDYLEQFYQMNSGGNFTYKMTFDTFTPSHESFETNIDDIDEFNTIEDSDNDLESDQQDEEKSIIVDFADGGDIFGNL